MNQYYPRYVEGVKPPPTLRERRSEVRKESERKVRYWTCSKCGRKGEKVFINGWEFTTDRYCPNCKERTKHTIEY